MTNEFISAYFMYSNLEGQHNDDDDDDDDSNEVTIF